jgi:hypothetical protein
MATKLTYAQAETLAALYSAHCIDDFGYFDPIRVFPARDNRDNGHRRTCRSLAKKGLLVEATWPNTGYKANVAECNAAWDEWRQKNPDAEFWF